MPRIPALKNNCRGMTLVEILIVTAILSFVMMAVISIYIPTQRSTMVQTRLADVQDNLRLALDRMSKDLLTAGFMLPSGAQAITGNTPSELTIQTRLVSHGFGRIIADASLVGANVKVKLSNNDMAAQFPLGASVRLVEGMGASEINEAAVPDPIERVYRVVGKPAADELLIQDPAGNLGNAAVVALIRKETVLVEVKDSGQPSIQTIRYRVNNGVLERIINGETQYLARGVTAVGFIYALNSYGKVHKVEITLTAQTQAVGTDAASKAKTRVLQTSVTLRNVT